jgi:hypothetical protein
VLALTLGLLAVSIYGITSIQINFNVNRMILDIDEGGDYDR